MLRLFKHKSSFKKEFKKQIKLAIIAAVGLTIAFSWREAIFNTFENFVSRFLDIPPDHYLSNIYTAITITLAGVLIILGTSKILKGD